MTLEANIFKNVVSVHYIKLENHIKLKILIYNLKILELYIRESLQRNYI
jgi:hypothetical protein